MRLMVEQTYAGEGHGDAVFVACLDDVVITYGTAGLSNVLHATLVGSLHVVAKGEESIGT